MIELVLVQAVVGVTVLLNRPLPGQLGILIIEPVSRAAG